MDSDMDVEQLIIEYRSPPSNINGHLSSAFLDDEWPIFLTRYTTTNKDILIIVDLNFHLEIKDGRDTQPFVSVLESCSLQQLVHEQTHVHDHVFVVVIARHTSSVVSDLDVTNPGGCNHMGRLTKYNFANTFIPKTTCH